jgi:hypothetical protein
MFVSSPVINALCIAIAYRIIEITMELYYTVLSTMITVYGKY